MIPPTLSTDRLIIEPLAMKHWEAYAAAWADPRMTKFIGGEPRSRNESWGKFLAGTGLWSIFGYGYWAFCDRATGKFVGNGGLAQWERGIVGLEGHPEAGWAFAHDAWGKGYATEAMTAILDWADQTRPEPEVRCIIDIDNVASMRVGEKLGFTLIETSEGTTGPLGLFSRKRRNKNGG
jgi:RimJ/RimL family protein N-acetyltransferase